MNSRVIIKLSTINVTSDPGCLRDMEMITLQELVLFDHTQRSLYVHHQPCLMTRSVKFRHAEFASSLRNTDPVTCRLVFSLLWKMMNSLSFCTYNSQIQHTNRQLHQFSISTEIVYFFFLL